MIQNRGLVASLHLRSFSADPEDEVASCLIKRNQIVLICFHKIVKHSIVGEKWFQFQVFERLPSSESALLSGHSELKAKKEEKTASDFHHPVSLSCKKKTSFSVCQNFDLQLQNLE